MIAGKRLGPKLEQLSQDFLQFDGNPQGIRILTRLQGRTKGERKDYGMDLTYSQILTALKYPRGPLDPSTKWEKKPGFFESERSRVEPAWTFFEFDSREQRRFPLAYIVEAADDISYCIGDMEDGIDRSILSPRTLFDELKNWIKEAKHENPLDKLREKAKECWESLNPPNLEAVRAEASNAEIAKDIFMEFKTDFTTAMIAEAARAYGDGSSPAIRNGECQSLLDNSDAADLLATLKGIARKFLYPADKVQRPFMAGMKVAQGILEEYSRLLCLPYEHFSVLRETYRSSNREKVSNEKLETLLPLLDLLPAHYLDVYDAALTEEAQMKRWGPETWELYCRAHLVVDYLAGMTDDYAFRIFQLFSGARLG